MKNFVEVGDAVIAGDKRFSVLVIESPRSMLLLKVGDYIHRLSMDGGAISWSKNEQAWIVTDGELVPMVFTRSGGFTPLQDAGERLENRLTASYILGVSGGMRDAADMLIEISGREFAVDRDDKARTIREMGHTLLFHSQEKRKDWEKFKKEHGVD